MTNLCVERKTIVEKLDILDFGNSKLNVEQMISEINKNGSDLLILGSKRQKTGVDLLTLGAITMPGTHPWLQVHQPNNQALSSILIFLFILTPFLTN